MPRLARLDGHTKKLKQFVSAAAARQVQKPTDWMKVCIEHVSVSLSAQSYLKAVRSFDLKVLSYEHNTTQQWLKPCLLLVLHDPTDRVVLSFCDAF